MDKRILQFFFKVAAALAYVALSFYLFTLIDKKYDNSISQFFWFIIFVLFLIAFLIETKKKKNFLTISMAILFITVQGLILWIPKLQEFVYNLFE